MARTEHHASSLNLNLALLCGLAAIDGADMQLLPSSFRAMEGSLGLTLSNLSLLSLSQGVAVAVAGPFWANLADSGACSRRRMLAAGAVAWGVLTLSLAFVSNFQEMLVLRVLNGLALGSLWPIVQSLVAEDAATADRGRCFGCIYLSNQALGMGVSAIVITTVSQQTLFGMQGWRVAYVAISGLSLVMAFLVLGFYDEKPRRWQPEKLGVVGEFQKFGGYLQIQTFQVIVLQGVFGSIPSVVLSFTTMYFQYVGLPDALAGAVFAMYVFGAGFGSLLGGIIGDWLASWSPFHGRPLTAQISVFLGIPIVAVIFSAAARSPERATAHGCLMFTLGICSSWCPAACKNPIFLEIVSPSNRASVFAWDYTLEKCFASLVGPLTVAAVSQHFFGYHPQMEADVTRMPDGERATNANALGNAIILNTVFPWIVCFFLFGFLHFTYKHDLNPTADADGDDAGELGECLPLVEASAKLR